MMNTEENNKNGAMNTSMTAKRTMTSDLRQLQETLCAIENITEDMFSKINSGTKCAQSNGGVEVTSISDALEYLKDKSEKIYTSLDQLNSVI